MGRAARAVRAFAGGEAGTTGFMLMWLSLCIIFGGLAVDISNSYRVKQQMSQTADVAAHAGVVALAQGADEAGVRAAVQASVESNMPAAANGNMLPNPATDIQMVYFDQDANTVSSGKSPGKSDEPPNAVYVQLTRSKATANALPTIFLRLADVFDRDEFDYSSWDISDSGIAAFTPSRSCDSTDWIYAGGLLSLSSQNTFGSGYCVHGQDYVWLAQQNTFDPGSGLSMPDLADCQNKCDDSANPGATAASFEQNLGMESPDKLVADLVADFTSYDKKSNDFFAKKKLDSDLSQLVALGIDTTGLQLGSLVNLTRDQFEGLDAIPSGLVYDVACPVPGGSLYFDAPSTATAIREVVLITDCALDFDDLTIIEASLIISTFDTTGVSVSSGSGAQIGTQASTCQPDAHSYIYALGGLQAAAKFSGSNLTIVTKGDMHFAASTSRFNSIGLSLYSKGDIQITAGHDFVSCAPPWAGLKVRLGSFRMLELPGAGSTI